MSNDFKINIKIKIEKLHVASLASFVHVNNLEEFFFVYVYF